MPFLMSAEALPTGLRAIDAGTATASSLADGRGGQAPAPVAQRLFDRLLAGRGRKPRRPPT
jgi:hypothetical protein